jgi:hypothetical protein
MQDQDSRVRRAVIRAEESLRYASRSALENLINLIWALVKVRFGPFMLVGARSFDWIAAMRLTAARSPKWQMLREAQMAAFGREPDISCTCEIRRWANSQCMDFTTTDLCKTNVGYREKGLWAISILTVRQMVLFGTLYAGAAFNDKDGLPTFPIFSRPLQIWNVTNCKITFIQLGWLADAKNNEVWKWNSKKNGWSHARR